VRLLVLGGTKFLGRAVVEEALERGHAVTLLTRGETNPELFPDAERLRGDRNGDLTALEGREWDAVLDTSGYLPRVVRASAELLADHAAHYTFVSSISVYSDFSEPAGEDDTPLTRLDDTSDESLEGERYGGFKALCERVVDEVFPGRSALVRPGLIVGPNDPTRRFTYWPKRVAQGGEVLAPGRRGRQVQFVDARDLASWLVDLGERRTDGTFNATGPGAEATPASRGSTTRSCARRTSASGWSCHSGSPRATRGGATSWRSTSRARSKRGCRSDRSPRRCATRSSGRWPRATRGRRSRAASTTAGLG
jgi:2'-hydroxyisoflavone reductase